MDKIKELERKSRARNTAWTVAVFALLVLWAVIVLFPFYWMLLTSVKSYASYNAEYVPKFFTLSYRLSLSAGWNSKGRIWSLRCFFH